MMKLSLLIFYKEYQAFLGELREKGMVHIHENAERTAEDTNLQAKLMLIRRTGEMITHMQSRNCLLYTSYLSNVKVNIPWLR